MSKAVEELRAEWLAANATVVARQTEWDVPTMMRWLLTGSVDHQTVQEALRAENEQVQAALKKEQQP